MREKERGWLWDISRGRGGASGVEERTECVVFNNVGGAGNVAGVCVRGQR